MVLFLFEKLRINPHRHKPELRLEEQRQIAVPDFITESQTILHNKVCVTTVSPARNKSKLFCSVPTNVKAKPGILADKPLSQIAYFRTKRLSMWRIALWSIEWLAPKKMASTDSGEL